MSLRLRQQTKQRLEGIGRKIKEARLESNLAQKKLAGLSGISVNYLCLIEAGKRLPSYWALERISNVFKASPEEMIGETEAFIQRKILLQKDLEAKREFDKLERLGSLFNNIDFRRLRKYLFC